MNRFLSHLHTQLRTARLTRRGASRNEKDVQMGMHKEYPRMHRIMLAAPSPIDVSLTDALDQRHSAHDGDLAQPISIDELSDLLGHALKKHDGSIRRNYPSGGALFPIETYLICTAVKGVGSGVFHYHPTAHALEKLWDLPAGFDLAHLAKFRTDLPVSALIVFTSVWQRSSVKYGDLSYQHALIEAGHMSENILLLGAALDIAVRPYAGFSDTIVTQLLDLDDEMEQPVHSITLCKQKSSRAGAGSEVSAE